MSEAIPGTVPITSRSSVQVQVQDEEKDEG